jgi:2-hydroxy-6-oxonona-2,4-dienedioate hydrolase
MIDARRLGEVAVEWSRTHRVPVGPWRVRYREAGAGPVLVLAHGLGCSADYWLRNGPPLAAAGFRVLAPDLPGFGRTDGPWRGLNVAAQAAALSAWASAMALPPAAYVGHSLSCQAVVELAAREAERVTALVLTAPTGDRRRKRRLREVLGFLRDIPREPLTLVPWIADAYLRAGLVRWAGTWWAGKRHDLFGAARQVSAPSLVLVGGEDPVVSADFAGAVAAALQNGRVRVIPGGAHALIYDAAEEFNAAVVDFLRQALNPGRD